MQSPLKIFILPAYLLATQPALAELTVAEQTGLPEQGHPVHVANGVYFTADVQRIVDVR